MVAPLQHQTPDTLQAAWTQYISKRGWVGDMSFGMNSSHHAFPIDIDWEDLTTVIPNILGYAKKNGTAIARTLPWKHPIFPMYATKIMGIEGVAWKDKQQFPDGPFSAYQLARLMVLFETLPFAVRTDFEDDEPVPEYERFVEKRLVPSAQFLTRERGAYVYDASAPSGIAGKDVDTGGGGILALKVGIKLIWHSVPDDGLFTAGGIDFGGTPANLLACVGFVNNATFLGYPAGTLLCEAPELEPVTMPVEPDLIYTGPPYWAVPRSWRVTVNLSYFNPEPNDGVNLGWGLVPYPANKKWYKIVTKSGGLPLYDSVDFTTMFKMN